MKQKNKSKRKKRKIQANALVDSAKTKNKRKRPKRTGRKAEPAKHPVSSNDRTDQRIRAMPSFQKLRSEWKTLPKLERARLMEAILRTGDGSQRRLARCLNKDEGTVRSHLHALETASHGHEAELRASTNDVISDSRSPANVLSATRAPNEPTSGPQLNSPSASAASAKTEGSGSTTSKDGLKAECQGLPLPQAKKEPVSAPRNLPTEQATDVPTQQIISGLRSTITAEPRSMATS